MENKILINNPILKFCILENVELRKLIAKKIATIRTKEWKIKL